MALKAIKAYRLTMEEQNALDITSMSLWVYNVIIAIITMDTLNLIVAAFGFLAMTAANIVKIVLAFRELRNLRRNNWQKSNPTEDEKK